MLNAHLCQLLSRQVLTGRGSLPYVRGMEAIKAYAPTARPHILNLAPARAPRLHPLESLSRSLSKPFLKRLVGWRAGRLDMTLPDGSQRQYGQLTSKRRARVEIHDWRFFGRALLSGDIGIGESYMAGEWSSPDLVELCEMVAESPQLFEQRAISQLPAAMLHTVMAKIRANTPSRSRRNIAEHYDLSNELYATFLDESMMYSAALYDQPTRTLHEAQIAKLEDICQRLELGPDDHVLEIGSGWGSFAIHAAKTRGCRVTSVTLSVEQRRMAIERAKQAGVGKRVDFQLRDYRDLAGQYDAIVSIEMIEAVGHEYLATFFQTIEKCLVPDGRVFLQGITVPDQHYDRYRKGFDWIRKYIFPGGSLLSVSTIATAVRDNTQLRIDWMRDIGPDYARTLEEWRSRFHAGRSRVKELGFDDRFIRMWDLYLASCEATFATGYTGDLQLVLSRPHSCRGPRT